jgi:hypothetical protein
MGHSSIQVTVDIYRRLIPGANVSFVDRLDEALERQEKTTPTTKCNTTYKHDRPVSCVFDLTGYDAPFLTISSRFVGRAAKWIV